MAKKTAMTNRGPLGFEATLWAAADKLRGHMDAAEYKHFVLGLVFLKYISDAFEARRMVLATDPDADPEDPGEYVRAGVFWVPIRWEEPGSEFEAETPRGRVPVTVAPLPFVDPAKAIPKG